MVLCVSLRNYPCLVESVPLLVRVTQWPRRAVSLTSASSVVPVLEGWRTPSFTPDTVTISGLCKAPSWDWCHV